MTNETVIRILRAYQRGNMEEDIPPHSFDLTDETVEHIISVLELDKWISVEERLPDFEGACLCMRKSYVCPGMRHQEIMYVDENGFYNIDDVYAEPGNVTHWRPLPEPPKEET